MKQFLLIAFWALLFCVLPDTIIADKSSAFKDGSEIANDKFNSKSTFLNAGFNFPSYPIITVCSDQQVGYLPPVCICDGKIVEMTVIYDGPANATVNVGPNSTGSNPFTNSNTQSGDTLVINLGNIGNAWYFIVNGVQDANIHASCSDDILNNVNSTKSDFGHLGSYPNPDQNSNDGTFLVIGYMDDKGNVCPAGGVNGMLGGATAIISSYPDSGAGPYSFLWSNGATNQNINVSLNSSTTFTVTVTDANGLTASTNHTVTLVDISCPGYPDKIIMCDNGSQKCVSKNYLCQKLADGYTLGPCGYDFSQPNNCGSIFPLPNCPCICDGKIIEMTVVYDGPAGATVSVGPNSSGTNPYINTNTQPGDILVINLGNIGNNWYYLVNGVQDADIHASCSDDILNNINSTKSDYGHLGSYPNPDQNSTDGTFLVIGYKDDNGNVCPSGGVQGPDAVDDFVTVMEGSSTAIQVLLNDTDPNNNIDISSLTIVTGPFNGNATVNSSTGIVTYIPDTSFSGIDSFIYVICNSLPLCDTATVYITVIVDTTNQIPTAIDDSVSTTQGVPVTIDVQLNDSDPDGDPLITSIVIPPLNGTVTVINGDSVIYTPNSTFIGTDIFTYMISDGNGGIDTAIVTIIVGTGVNHPPIAIDDSSITNQGVPVTINVQLNDSDPDGDPLITSIVIPPLNGTVTVINGDSVIYTPNSTFIGTDIFTYMISDGNGGIDTAIVTIIVSAGNHPPIAIDDSSITNQGVPVTINVQLNDSDPDGDPLITSIVIPPLNGTVTVINGDSVIYTPNSTFIGTDIFTYMISDGNGGIATATVTIIVIPGGPNPPLAIDDSVFVNTGDTVDIQVLINDSDPNNSIDTSSLTIISGPSNGTATVNILTGIVTYIPNINFYGKDSFEYVICNTIPLCDIATVYITIDSINIPLPPIAVDDSAIVNQGSSVGISVIINDSFPPNNNVDISSLMVISGPSSGTTSVDTITGVVTYIPNTNYYGLDSFVYIICNTIPLCDSATVYITIDSLNLCPIAVDDNITVIENTAFTFNPLLNDIDDNGLDPTSVSIFTQPLNGTATVDSVSGEITYTPNLNFTGNDLIEYRVCDIGLPICCDSASIYITVIDSTINQCPIASDDSITVIENVAITFNPLLNDIDDNGLDPTSVSIFTQPLNGTATVDPVSGEITYTPNLNFTGNDLIEYRVCDIGLPICCDSASIYITVIDSTINQCPIASDDSIAVIENVAITFNPLLNDIDDNGLDPTSVSIFTQPLNGTATVDPVSGEITYTPNLNFTGNDLIEYRVCDIGLPICCDSASIYITVIDSTVNQCPIASDDSITVIENVAITFNPLLNDIDDNGLDPTSVSIFTQPLNGTATVDPVSGEITYTPNLNFTGNDLIEYRVCDIGLPICCDSASIYITVIDSTINQCPIASDDSITVIENVAITFNPLLNDIDDNGLDPTSVSIFTQPLNGTATVDPVSGEITYTPNLNFTGNDLIEYRVCDIGLPICCDSASIYITVIDSTINQCPIASDDSITVIENVAITFNPLLNDIDDNGLDPTSVSIFTQPLNGTATVDPVSGEITYTPNLNFTGNDLIEYRVCDIGLPICCDSASIYITVIDSTINQCPIASDDSIAVIENVAITFNPLLNDIDDNGLDPTSVSIFTQPLNGTATVDPVSGEITYTPNLNFTGNDLIEYRVCDIGLPICCDSASIVITVVSCPLPIANAGPNQDLCDTTTSTSLNANTTGTGENGNWTIIAGNAVVTDTSSANSGVTGLTLGSYTLVWTISNQCGTSADTLVLNVTDSINCCENTPLVAMDDTVITMEDDTINIFVLANDNDPEGNIDASSLTIKVPPKNGLASVNPNGSIRYEPGENFFGEDSLQYEVCDTGCAIVNCDTAWVRITVNPVNDCPVALDDSISTLKNILVEIIVMVNDTDIDGQVDPTTVNIISGPSNGIAMVNSVTGEITYSPFADFIGSDIIVYSICDTGNPVCCDTAIVYIKVEGDCDICVPQCLSPNGDFIGDRLEIKCIEEYPENELIIFNRWGNCVYRMKNYDNTWDGTSNTGPIPYGDELHDGTYYYVFDKGNGSKPINGFLVLKRK